MVIILVSPIAVYLTFLVLLALVFGFTRRTIYVSLLVFGLMALLAALAAANYASYFIEASRSDSKAQAQVANYALLLRANVWLQALGWPALLGGFFAFKRGLQGYLDPHPHK